jgi:hypothetical protein
MPAVLPLHLLDAAVLPVLCSRSCCCDSSFFLHFQQQLESHKYRSSSPWSTCRWERKCKPNLNRLVELHDSGWHFIFCRWFPTWTHHACRVAKSKAYIGYYLDRSPVPMACKWTVGPVGHRLPTHEFLPEFCGSVRGARSWRLFSL